jgi:thioredoxin reductase (NADPH)
MANVPVNGIYDLVIVGGGPAGLSAAVNAKARNLSCLLLECRTLVSNLGSHPDITNYLGFPKISGVELADIFTQHFARTGYDHVKDKVLKIMPQVDCFMIGTSREIFTSKTIILAVGISRSKTLPGEQEFLGHGVAYCVTCDGALYADQNVIVVGYIPEAEEEANTLAGFARNVTYIPIYDKVGTLKANVKVLRETPVAILGDTNANRLKTGEGELKADGIFVIREALPVDTMLDGLEMAGKFIQVDCAMSASVPGVFAAGDCTGTPFQIARAVGQGQIAALSAAKYAQSTSRSSSS